MKTSNNIVCTVSAGYSSMMMAIKMKEWYPEDNIIYLFANTEMEDQRSLDFLKECSDYYGLDIVYLVPVINQRGTGTTYTIVNWEDLRTDGKVFEDGIKKYGIPNTWNKWCTREMKTNAVTKYSNDVFGNNDWCVALGIRIDEIDRVSDSYKDNNIFYPLIDNKIDSRARNKFWSEQPIKLKLKAYEGNCTLCFEKSNRKKMTIISEHPEKAIWWDEMEKKYSTTEIHGKHAYNAMANDGGVFFGRGNLSIQELVKLSKEQFKKATDEYLYENELFDQEGDCGVSCKIFD
jgi:3'-phosphoadenosine 5'-phosphosulfate sulfotransferase (PAPS reductase)/FAD synthetase